MGFKGLNHLFCYVAAVHIRGNKLEDCLTFFLDL